MKSLPKYDSYSRDELIELLNCNNKQIESHRSMLNQTRARRNKLYDRVKQLSKESATLSRQIEKLNQCIAVLKSYQWKAWSMKEFAPVIMNTIIAYKKLKKEGYVTDNEMFFMILAHQQKWFFQSTVLEFNKQWGRNPDVCWRNELRILCEAGYFHKSKIGRRIMYYLTWRGKERLEDLLNYMYQGK